MKIAEHFCISTKTVNVVLKRWRVDGDTKRRLKDCGRKRLYPDLIQQLKMLPLDLRRTVRCAAENLNLPRSVIQDRIQSGELIQVNSRAKLSLTDNNKVW